MLACFSAVAGELGAADAERIPAFQYSPASGPRRLRH